MDLNALTTDQRDQRRVKAAVTAEKLLQNYPDVRRCRDVRSRGSGRYQINKRIRFGKVVSVSTWFSDVVNKDAKTATAISSWFGKSHCAR